MMWHLMVVNVAGTHEDRKPKKNFEVKVNLY